MKKRIVIGISGASGSILAYELLTVFRKLPEWETHLVVSSGGEQTIALETDHSLQDYIDLADYYHNNSNIGASIASGTFRTEGMIIVPCSMKTVAGVASGYSDNLLLRAADVTLKEGRKLVLVTRETPLSRIHLKNMLEACEAGAVILPPMMSFYNGAQTGADMASHIVGKILDRFDISYDHFHRWDPENNE